MFYASWEINQSLEIVRTQNTLQYAHLFLRFKSYFIFVFYTTGGLLSKKYSTVSSFSVM